MIRKLVLLLAGLVVLGGLGWIGLASWTPSRAAYPTQGVDVSEANGEIDWKAAHAAGVDFAYLRASEGSELRDERFAANWAQTAEAGVKRGATHVFNLCTSARDQATNFIAMVPREAEALPHALDLEFGDNCLTRPTRQALLGEVAIFIQMVEAHSEKPMMLYLTREFEDRYHISEAIDRPLWLLRIGLTPGYGAHPWVMWQANPRHRVDGIEGPVDWDVVRPQ